MNDYITRSFNTMMKIFEQCCRDISLINGCFNNTEFFDIQDGLDHWVKLTIKLFWGFTSSIARV